jgi:hypothetical protein
MRGRHEKLVLLRRECRPYCPPNLTLHLTDKRGPLRNLYLSIKQLVTLSASVSLFLRFICFIPLRLSTKPWRGQGWRSAIHEADCWDNYCATVESLPRCGVVSPSVYCTRHGRALEGSGRAWTRGLLMSCSRFEPTTCLARYLCTSLVITEIGILEVSSIEMFIHFI